MGMRDLLRRNAQEALQSGTARLDVFFLECHQSADDQADPKRS